MIKIALGESNLHQNCQPFLVTSNFKSAIHLRDDAAFSRGLSNVRNLALRVNDVIDVIQTDKCSCPCLLSFSSSLRHCVR